MSYDQCAYRGSAPVAIGGAPMPLYIFWFGREHYLTPPAERYVNRPKKQQRRAVKRRAVKAWREK